MSAEMIAHFEMYFRLAIGGALGLGGVLLVLFAQGFAQTQGLFRHVNLNPKLRYGFLFGSEARDPVEGQPVLEGHSPLVGVLASTIRQRLFRAAAERDRLVQPGLTAYARAIGAFAIISSICTFAPRVPMMIPYAVFYAALGCISLAAFMRSKARLPKRVAALDVRAMGSSLPPYQIVLGVLVALTPLILLPNPDARWVAIVTCVGSLLVVYVSIKMTEAPSQLRGDDLVAERFVDRWIRQYRSRWNLLGSCTISVLTITLVDLGKPPDSVYAALLPVIADAIVLFSMCALALSGMVVRLTPGEIEELEAS